MTINDIYAPTYSILAVSNSPGKFKFFTNSIEFTTHTHTHTLPIPQLFLPRAQLTKDVLPPACPKNIPHISSSLSRAVLSNFIMNLATIPPSISWHIFRVEKLKGKKNKSENLYDWKSSRNKFQWYILVHGALRVHLTRLLSMGKVRTRICQILRDMRFIETFQYIWYTHLLRICQYRRFFKDLHNLAKKKRYTVYTQNNSKDANSDNVVQGHQKKKVVHKSSKVSLCIERELYVSCKRAWKAHTVPRARVWILWRLVKVKIKLYTHGGAVSFQRQRFSTGSHYGMAPG